MAEYSSDTVSVFQPPYSSPTGTAFSVITPTSVAFDAYGDVYATDYVSTNVQRFDPPYVTVGIAPAYAGFTSPHAVAMWP